MATEGKGSKMKEKRNGKREMDREKKTRTELFSRFTPTASILNPTPATLKT